MIILKNIQKKFLNFNLNVSFTVDKSKIISIIGKSGSGKSTILKIIQGIIKPDNGEVLLDSNTKISYIFQEFNLLNNLTVFENVKLPLKIKGIRNDEKVLEALNYVSLIEKKDDYISNLSGGQKQRVAIARAIVLNPDLLLCDEPTSSLDEEVKNEIINLFLKINKDFKTTIIVVTHELDVAKRISDEIILIKEGKLIEKIYNKRENKFIQSFDYYNYAKEVFND